MTKKRCNICCQVYDIENFISKYTGNIIRVCTEYCLLGSEGQKALKGTICAHLRTRCDGSKITDPWEVVDDGKPKKCTSCKKLKAVKDFNLSCGKYSPRLTKLCSVCLNKKATRVSTPKDNPS